MTWIAWDDLPEMLRREEIWPYYVLLQKKRGSLWVKRMGDILAAMLLLAVLWPMLAVIAVIILLDSPGPVFFRQTRITQYGKPFRIFKFRTMQEHAEKDGPALTQAEDRRITRFGSYLRKWRLDELPQLFNILRGDMSFVGTRPEVPGYVESYTPQMLATLLLPAGLTSEASIRYKDEAQLLIGAQNIDRVYTSVILPEKMRWNLAYLETYSLMGDILILLRTVLAVLK